MVDLHPCIQMLPFKVFIHTSLCFTILKCARLNKLFKGTPIHRDACPIHINNCEFCIIYCLADLYSKVRELHCRNLTLFQVENDCIFLIGAQININLVLLWIWHGTLLITSTNLYNTKELSLCHKCWFSNPYIFATQCRRP